MFAVPQESSLPIRILSEDVEVNSEIKTIEVEVSFMMCAWVKTRREVKSDRPS